MAIMLDSMLIGGYCFSVKPKFHLARHVSTRHDTFDVSSPHILAASSLSHSTARHTRHDERDRRDSQLSLLCNSYKVIICKLFTNLLEYRPTVI